MFAAAREAYSKWFIKGTLDRKLCARLEYTITRTFNWQLRSRNGDKCSWRQLRNGKPEEILAFAQIPVHEQIVVIGAFIVTTSNAFGTCVVFEYTLFTEVWPQIPAPNNRSAWELVERKPFNTLDELKLILDSR